MFLEKLNESLWILGFLPLFIMTSLALFPLVSGLLRSSRGEVGEGSRTRALRPYQAAGTVLAATVGTGNIVGTAQAIAMGGPGAVFWMWTAALLGCSVKAGEIVFGQRFGGAMQYINAVLGRVPAGVYALLAMFSTLLVGNMAQVNASVLALRDTGLFAGAGRLAICLAVAAAAGLCLRRGVSSAGRICGVFVPVMTGLYVSGALLFLAARREEIVPGLLLIVRSAFSGRAALGAASGLGLRAGILWGLRRGCFSNEAGLGSAANIHALSGMDGRPGNGIWGLVEVLVDTVLLCTLSALVILCSGLEIPYGALPGPELTRAAYTTVWGAREAGLFTALSLAAFGFSTVLGCYVSGQRCASWLGMGERSFRLLYLFCCLIGGLAPLPLIWRTADAVHVLMAVPNLLALLFLARGKGIEKEDA